MAKSLPISLCMIVKNEKKFLGAALKSAKALLGIDDIVVVDTGSTDGTKEIALANGAKVHDFVWCNDFSAARNFSAEHARFDWVFYLDADEEITEVDLTKLSEFIKKERSVGVCTRIELTDYDASPVSRLYNRKYYELQGTIHEQVEPLGNFTKKLINIPITLIHHGYLPEVSKEKGTHERNARMLKDALKKQPNDPYLLYKLGNAYMYKDEKVACEYLEKALEFISDHRLLYAYEAVELYGYALINTEQYEKALALRDKYAEKYGEKPQFRFLEAHILQNNGMFLEAVQSYESCIGADIIDYMGITSFLSYYNIGVILECVGMLDEATEMYKNCPNYEPAKLRLAELKANDK